ncbi:MAG: TonB-dependent receptor [Bacteroidota bacterium]
MIRRAILWMLILLMVILPFCLKAQQADTDTTRLQEVAVTAFYGRNKWQTIPAAIAVISTSTIKNSPTPSLLPVMNSQPGIRMEERSPGSYRFSIRGSLLRSPFGVRNIKVYLDELPLTDGGGNTYLNLIDLTQINAAEILKGPVAAAYGAGTGGAVLLQSPLHFSVQTTNRFSAGIAGGSYELFQEQAGWMYSSSKFSSNLQQVHLQSDGYREQSAMRRDGLKWQGAVRAGQHNWRFLSFYTNLYYQTPGGINEVQFNQNPRQARQPAGMLPGAIQQKTAIYNQTFYNGVQHQVKLDNRNSIRSFAVMSVAGFKNPFITNYEERKEDNFGAGTQWQYQQQSGNHQWQLNTGGEWQYQHSLIDNFGNRAGIKDTVQYRDKVFAVQWFLFSQLQYKFRDKLQITAGISTNQQLYRYKRLTDPGSIYARRQIAGMITPRLALSYSVSTQLNLYAILAKGFSAPTLAEFRPSDGNFYGNLNAESGWNIEAGFKGMVLNERVLFDIAFYRFKLNNAIVRRNSNSGAEYFVNAGGTLQQGMELMVKTFPVKNGAGKIKTFSVWSGYAYQPYRFTSYRQAAIDYSNKKLTGVPSGTWVMGFDLQLRKGIYLASLLNIVSSIPLNDANDAYAKPYQLLQGRIGYRVKRIDIFMAVDNALNQTYSLGNDINAFGRRYYNAAATRNYMFGMNFGLR